MRRHRLRLRARFLLSVLLVVAVISGVMAYMTYQRTREALLDSSQEQLWDLAGSHAAELALRLEKVAQVARDLASTLGVLQPRHPDLLVKLMRRHLEDSPRVHGLAVAFQPYAFSRAYRLFGVYLRRSRRGILTMRMGTSREDGGEPWWPEAGTPGESRQTVVKDYPRRDWYLLPVLLARPTWIQPYYGEAGQKLMTTYAVPILIKGKVWGVVSADVALDKLGWEVSRLAVGQEGYAFVITRQGTFVAAPRAQWVMRETIFSLAEELNRMDLRRLGQRMIRGGRGVLKVEDWFRQRAVWLAFTPIKGPGWCFGAVVPESEVLAPVWEQARWQGYLAGLGLLGLVLLLWLLVMGLTRPLKTLAGGAQRLAEGDLQTKVEGVPPGDEVGDLAEAFNHMVDELNRYVAELTETTAAKERIESELDLARQIQQSILPRTYPPFPHHSQFDLFARTIPARQVGGDFYDFFQLPDGRIGLVVADVSGKGVPAALFMTVTRTLIKNSSAYHPDPVQALLEVNAQVVPENEMCMFVTVFYGVYDPESGEMVYASAGHPAPFLRRASGEVERLEEAKGQAIGIMDVMDLKPGRVRLEPGDVLLAFTDGLDEAVNQQNEMFGMERVAQWLKGCELCTAPEMIERLVKFHAEFTGPVEPFDDLTLLVFRRKE